MIGTHHINMAIEWSFRHGAVQNTERIRLWSEFYKALTLKRC
jgi:hypothetical protein